MAQLQGVKTVTFSPALNKALSVIAPLSYSDLGLDLDMKMEFSNSVGLSLKPKDETTSTSTNTSAPCKYENENEENKNTTCGKCLLVPPPKVNVSINSQQYLNSQEQQNNQQSKKKTKIASSKINESDSSTSISTNTRPLIVVETQTTIGTGCKIRDSEIETGIKNMALDKKKSIHGHVYSLKSSASTTGISALAKQQNSEEQNQFKKMGERNSGSATSLNTNSPRPLRRLSKLRPNSSLSDLRAAAIAARVTQRDVITVFGDMLDSIAKANDSNPPSKKTALFRGKNIPKMKIQSYLWRLVYYLNKYPAVEPTFFAESENALATDNLAICEVSEDIVIEAMSRGLRGLLLALTYIDRVSERHDDFLVSSYTLHRIVLTALLIAIKFTDDYPMGVDIFARLGGVQRRDMQKMELEFCSLIGFDFNVSDLEFNNNCMKQLRLAFDVAQQRGGSYEGKEGKKLSKSKGNGSGKPR